MKDPFDFHMVSETEIEIKEPRSEGTLKMEKPENWSEEKWQEFIKDCEKLWGKEE